MILVISIGLQSSFAQTPDAHWQEFCDSTSADERTTIGDFVCSEGIFLIADRIEALEDGMIEQNDRITDTYKMDKHLQMLIQLNLDKLLPNSPNVISVENNDETSTITWTYTQKPITTKATYFIVELDDVIIEDNYSINATSYIFKKLTNDVVYDAKIIAVNDYGISSNIDNSINIDNTNDDTFSLNPVYPDIDWNISIESTFLELGDTLLINGTMINFRAGDHNLIDITTHLTQCSTTGEQFFTTRINQDGTFSKSLVFGDDIIYGGSWNCFYNITVSYTNDKTIQVSKELTHPIPPYPVENIVVDDIGSDFVELSWDIDIVNWYDDYVVSERTGHEIIYASYYASEWTLINHGKNTSIRIDNLLNGTEYSIIIYTVSGYGSTGNDEDSNIYFSTLP